MDWRRLEADKTMIIPRHYTDGRQGRSIEGVTVHHMAGDLTTEGCYGVWCTREASAHYAVEADGTIGQLVNDWDTAWACGNWEANLTTVSIEHANDMDRPGWHVHRAALESGAHLVAAVCLMYGLGRPRWLVNVFPHSHFQATSCPGELAGDQNDEYMSLAQRWYDAMLEGKDTLDDEEEEVTYEEMEQIAEMTVDKLRRERFPLGSIGDEAAYGPDQDGYASVDNLLGWLAEQSRSWKHPKGGEVPETVVDEDRLAELIADGLGDGLAAKVADELAKRMRE